MRPYTTFVYICYQEARKKNAEKALEAKERQLLHSAEQTERMLSKKEAVLAEVREEERQREMNE
jgi:hypothetical protein